MGLIERHSARLSWLLFGYLIKSKRKVSQVEVGIIYIAQHRDEFKHKLLLISQVSSAKSQLAWKILPTWRTNCAKKSPSAELVRSWAYKSKWWPSVDFHWWPHLQPQWGPWWEAQDHLPASLALSLVWLCSALDESPCPPGGCFKRLV